MVVLARENFQGGFLQAKSARENASNILKRDLVHTIGHALTHVLIYARYSLEYDETPSILVVFCFEMNGDK